MKFALAVFAVVGVTFCSSYPTEQDLLRYSTVWDGDELLLDDGTLDIEQYVNLLGTEEWSLVPLINGLFRLVNVNDAKAQYEMMEPNPDAVVTFQLHTRLNREVPQFINDTSSLKESNFDPRRPTKFITHGWLNRAASDVNVVLRKAILDNCDCNVFVVDWSAGADTLNYIKARYSVSDTGTKLADFLDFLNLSGKMSFKDLTLIGHSLGAHASGLAAKRVKQGKVHIIIGLDAAYPLFTVNETNNRLDQGDADYVQTIHTSAGTLGFLAPLGHASFYPNWGTNQPGCGVDILGKCSHKRSYQYYGESLYSNNSFVPFNCLDFVGFQERRCVLMEHNMRMGGEPAYQNFPKGVYMLPTNAAQPFGLGEA